MTENELYYVAGLLEGEGCFTWQNSNRKGKKRFFGGLLIDIKMSDRDIIERYRQISGATAKIQVHKAANVRCRTQYGQRISGYAAANLMRLLLPLMGTRRSKKITSLLDYWDNRPIKKKRV